MIESAFEEGGYCSEDMVELCVFGQLDVDLVRDVDRADEVFYLRRQRVDLRVLVRFDFFVVHFF